MEDSRRHRHLASTNAEVTWQQATGGLVNFSLVLGGPLYRFYLRSGLARPPLDLVQKRVLASIVITWVPLAILAALDARAGGNLSVTFLKDLDAHLRFLVAIPLLIAAEPIVHERIGMAVRQFVDRGLIDPRDLRRFTAAVASSIRLRNSGLLEMAVLVVAMVGGHWIWAERMTLHVATWYGAPDGNGAMGLTRAGRWYVFVGLPLFRFLLLRWYVRLLAIWYRFLWKVSRIPLRLNALHPDRCGGLGFLDASVFAFIPVLVAQSVVLSAAIAEHIWNDGSRLPQFQIEILFAASCLLSLVLLPQTFFAVQLERTWRAGLSEYGAFGSRYVQAFRLKWLSNSPHASHGFMGSADIQSLADLANAFQIIGSMSLVPINRTTLFRLGIAIGAPFAPLILTIVPFDEIVNRLINTVL